MSSIGTKKKRRAKKQCGDNINEPLRMAENTNKGNWLTKIQVVPITTGQEKLTLLEALHLK